VATLFLDLYGVLVDSEVMEKAYNERMATILHRRYGGSIHTWRELQQKSYEWYLGEGFKLDGRPGPEREGDAWVEAVWRLMGDQIAWLFTRAGIPLPPNLPQYAEQLEEETVRDIDALFEDVRPVLPWFRSAGHRLFLSTNATRSNGESALIGGRVREMFDGIVCLENAKAKKDRPSYWRRAFDIAGVEPVDAICVDDVARFLMPAEELGARCVRFTRHDPPRNVQRFPVLTSLLALSAWLERD